MNYKEVFEIVCKINMSNRSAVDLLNYTEELVKMARDSEDELCGRIEELEAKLKKYEEPVAKFKGTAFDECQDITLYSNDRGRLVVDMYMTLGMEDEKEYEVIIIEADK